MNIEIKALSSIYLYVQIKTRVFDWMVLLPRALARLAFHHGPFISEYTCGQMACT